jgi:hypothetical protein
VANVTHFPVTLSPHLPIANSSRYTARLLSDVMFTGVVRQRCQSGLLSLETSVLQLSSAHFGSTRHGEEKHHGGGLPSDATSTSHYVYILTFRTCTVIVASNCIDVKGVPLKMVSED